MVIHYSASPEGVACGRTGTSLASTAAVAEVSCKLCLRSVEKKSAEPVRKTPSLAELRAAAKAAKSAASLPAATATAPNVVTVAAKADVAVKIEGKAVAVADEVKVAAEPAAKPPAASVRGEWQQRLQQLPGRNRLPRGMSRQAFI